MRRNIISFDTMDHSTIPLKHSSLPGYVRLPKRYEIIEDVNGNRKASTSSDASDKSMSGRLDDLSQAMIWVRHELILLRQHDILLKRQFGDIQDTIDSLVKCRCKTKHQNHKSSTLSIQSDCSSVDISLDNYGFRPATSFTLLNDDECDDVFDDTQMAFRPRTSSMKTTRDLAALARRRGSKDLI